MATSRYTVTFLIFILCFAVYRCSAGGSMSRTVISLCHSYGCGNGTKCPPKCKCPTGTDLNTPQTTCVPE
ncbi:hypothetical protein MTO96_039505 [Rhipicephalus appendiculatus]